MLKKKKKSFGPDLENGSGWLDSGYSALNTAVGSLGSQYMYPPPTHTHPNADFTFPSLLNRKQES